MKTLVIEGWRFLPHSYAVVNQWQCLELLAREGLRLYHTDVPFPMPTWRPDPGLFDAERDAKLRSIPPRPPDPGFRPDAVLRMGWPHWLHPDASGCPTFVWGTTEFKLVEPASVGGGLPPQQAFPASPCTIIACSNWAAEGFLNAGTPRERLHVVPCGVDTAIFHPATPQRRAELRRELGWEGRFVVLNISAMTGNKGVPFLMAAVATLLPKHPTLQLVLKGSDAIYKSQAMAAQGFGYLQPELAQRLQPCIAYLGQTLSTLQMASMYQAADAYVSPYTGEGFNLPVLEAAACGLPVVCTAGGSTDDFVDDSFALRIGSQEVSQPTGKRLLQPDLAHLAELLDRAVTDEAFRRQAAEAGPAWAAARFTWRASVDALLRVIFPGGL